MNKEFIPYEEALALKELGFDEPWLGYYNEDKRFFITSDSEQMDKYVTTLKKDYIKAPLYQQAFRWFREKYKLHSYIYGDYSWNISGGIWDLNGYKGSRYDWDSEPYNTYEEAELECLKKLIEIVKEKQ